MQFSLYINQKAAYEWGLNLNQAAVFSVIFSAAAWADKDGDYWNISKQKIVDELPILTDKVDTVYRLQKALIEKGLIEKKVVESKDFFRLTQKGMRWHSDKNSQDEGGEAPAEINPNAGDDDRKNFRGPDLNPSEGVFTQDDRKNIRESSEINPNKLGNISDALNNQNKITNINSSCSLAGEQMTENWWPPKEIELFCRQRFYCSDQEFDFLVIDYRVFWMSDDGLMRQKPRSWGNHFKNSFAVGLQRMRSDDRKLKRNSRDVTVHESLTNTSWAV